MILGIEIQEKILFHLGYTQATPARIRASAQRAFETIQGPYTEQRIIELVNQCESYYELLNNSLLVEEEKIVESGDRNLVTSNSKLPSSQTRQRQYLLATNGLASSLGIRNFRGEYSNQIVEGELFINSIPGAKGDKGDSGRIGISESISKDELYLWNCLFGK